MKLDPWQQNFIAAPGDKMLCTGRQVGKSVICGIDAGEYAATHSKEVILMIAPTERQAFALFEKTLNYLILNHRDMISKGKDRPTQTKINLKNGTRIWCLPTGMSGLGIRFLTVHRLYVDEASRVPDEVWTAITPMLLTTGGNCIYLSTPKGKRGVFYEAWINKDDAYNSFTRFSATSKDVLVKREICETWTEYQKEKALEHLEREKTRMTKVQYAQEYIGLFMDELSQMFPTDLIKKCQTIPHEVGALPTQAQHTNFLGVDVGGMGKDATVLVGVRKVNNKYIEQLSLTITEQTRTTDTIRLIKNFDLQYNYKRIFIDDGGIGVGVYDTLLEDNQTKRKVVAINNARRAYTREEKPKEKGLMKNDIYTNLLTSMEQGLVKIFDDLKTLSSLQSVQYEYTTEGKVKIFGEDTHIAEALARAVYCLKDKTLKVYFT